MHWKKYVLGCTIGNVLEIYNFILYAYFSFVLAKLFFPTSDPHISLLLTFAVFASGCFARPFGSLLFGHLGDKYGRRIALIISISLISLSTFSIGLLPIYNAIGLYAPALLILCRLFQGISMCGEEIGSALFLTENAPKNKTALAGSIVLGSVHVGFLFGSIITLITTTFVPHQSLLTWGWRIPFLLSLPLGIIALTIRMRQGESKAFVNVKYKQTNTPITATFKFYLPNIIRSIGLSAFLAVAIYLFAVYIPTYFNTTSKFDLQTTMIICTFSFLLTFIWSIVVGWCADFIGAKILMIMCCVGCLILSYPIFRLLAYHTIVTACVAEGMMILLLGLTAGSLIPLLIKLFPITLRFTGVGIGFNMSMTVFGSLAPIISLYLIHITHNPTAPSLYLMMAAFLTLLAVLYPQRKYSNTRTSEILLISELTEDHV